MKTINICSCHGLEMESGMSCPETGELCGFDDCWDEDAARERDYA